jgi:hypothetical protein
MNLYNALFGVDAGYPYYLGMLGLRTDDFGRFRDAYLNEDGTEVIVLTRCGGGNRDDYQWMFDSMETHPQFICEFDDSFDCTYAYIKFSVPEIHKKLCQALATRMPTPDIKKRLDDLMTKIKTMPMEEIKKDPGLNQVMGVLAKVMEFAEENKEQDNGT